MPSCENCWRLSGGDTDYYMELIKTNKCTPEEQAGPGATVCPVCRRKAVHQYVPACMACGQRFNDGKK